ncbi:sigma-54-dependent Fis family transcriptional regulator [Stigmatella aurantiaca]|uniref:Sigma-54 dependent transcriptional regulator, Fis family n=1 Tax=Stigmatella aurantiaca (strain DW4/3-1) TaxID=378806 RepID=Q08VB5_STIAD|nr:sigma-54-dependent Fis family transcriptional regulator [Stigmatella aurantiaca]ADO70975.1 Sigma-54 dependent transcriptional regulator, Fis family [Stigmatella aurantiaca DW4/3-1]EAU64434.1 transcriptional regulatory protein ZraR [Stigmatella aurantiaca DW4/3-1]
MPELVFFRRGEEVLRVGLEHERVVLGRGGQSDVVIPDPDISRRQVALQHDGTRCLLEDLSGRGTLVSGQPMAQGELADGADIALGQWRAVFRQRGSGAAEAPTGAHRNTALQAQARHAGTGQPVQLRVKQGATEFIHTPRGESFTVGKDPTCEVVVQDRFISGRHLKVTQREGIFHVVDLNSTNGTFLGTTRVFEVEVPLNTCLRVGETELLLESRTALAGEAARHGLIGDEPCIRQLLDLVERVAPSSAAVAIFGESGTGKELVARALHACSTRADQPLIPLNCAAISRELIESELFGHERGSFTGAQAARKGAFEEADGGTLFLDEVGELPLDLQAKLLRALESGEIKRVGASRPVHVDVRVVAATNRDLLAASREGKFREDLYYRLCVIPLMLPPLRNRRGDIAPLAEHFVRTYAPRGQAVKLTQDALERLQRYTWPGNVRELRNVVHRALLLRKGPKIDGDDISFDPEFGREPSPSLLSLTELPPGTTLDQMMTRLERQIIEHALRRHGGNREKVAKELSVARSTLFKRLKDWGLTKEEHE